MSPLLDLLATLLGLGASGYRSLLAEREALHAHAAAALHEWAASAGERLLHTPGNPVSLAVTLGALGAPPPGEPPGALGGRSSGAGPKAGGEGAGTTRGTTQGAAEGPAEGAAERERSEREHGAASSSSRGNGAPDPSAAQRGPPATFLGSMLFRRNVSGARVVARGACQSVAGLELAGWGAHCADYPTDYLTVSAALGGTRGDVDEFVRRLGICYAEFGRRVGKARGGSAGA